MRRIIILICVLFLLSSCTAPVDDKEPIDVGDFCGFSTKGLCTSDEDCISGGCSGQVCESINEEPIMTTCEWTECYNPAKYGITCGCVDNMCQWH